jgi:hypothetical protein
LGRMKNIKILSSISAILACILIFTAADSLWFFATGELRKLKTPDVNLSYIYEKRLDEINEIKLSEDWDLGIVGDSIAYSIDPKLLYKCCLIKAFNIGIPGETAQNLAMRIEQATIPSTDHFYLLVGTNDIGRNTQIPQVLNNIISISYRLGFSKVTFVSIPLTNGFQRDNKKLVELNAGIEALVLNSRANFLNINRALVLDGKLNDTLSDDGLHLNEKGVTLVIEMISNHHRSLL